MSTSTAVDGWSVYSYGHVAVQQCRGTEADTHGHVRKRECVCVCVCVCVSVSVCEIPSFHPAHVEQAGGYANSRAGHTDPGLEPAAAPRAPGALAGFALLTQAVAAGGTASFSQAVQFCLRCFPVG